MAQFIINQCFTELKTQQMNMPISTNSHVFLLRRKQEPADIFNRKERSQQPIQELV